MAEADRLLLLKELERRLLRLSLKEISSSIRMICNIFQNQMKKGNFKKILKSMFNESEYTN